MRRLLVGPWIVLVAVAGCKTADRTYRGDLVQQREQELHAVNAGLDARQQVTPRTMREMFDPLIMEPQQGPRPTR
jgi:hypothetical protein